jgi:hypothetical protein
LVAGSQLNEQAVLLAIHFLSWAQLPGGGAIFLAEATEKLAGSATVTASNATFTIEVIRMIVPHPFAKFHSTSPVRFRKPLSHLAYLDFNAATARS